MTDGARGRPLRLLAILALVVATLVAAPAAADHTDGPLVQPTTFAGNDTCPYKFDPPNPGTQTFNVDGTNVTITLTRDGNSFGFISSHPVQQVVAKGGPNYNLYDYTSLAFAVLHDHGLVAPTNPRTGQPYGLSHVSFCFGDAPITPEGTLDVEKTAEGSWDRDVRWTLEKSVDPDSHSGGPGAIFSSGWEVIATKIETGPENFKVVGEITVGWSGDFPVTVRVDDELDDGTIAVVDCGDGTNFIAFAAGTDEVVCTYEASPGNADAETNFVELVVLGTPDGDISGTLSAQADINWSENLTGDDAVLLEDDRKPHSETISSSTTLEYEEGFECPTDLTRYDSTGLYTETFPNTATLTGDNTDLEAQASVTITCRRVFQGETVTGAGDNWSEVGAKRKDRTNTWFQYTVGTSGRFDLVQGRQLNDVGDVHITNNGNGTTTLCFEFDDPWQLAPVAGNVKIQPLDAKPTAYIAPGQFEFHFTEPDGFGETSSDFCVTVDSGSCGYAIHLDAGYWVSG